MRCKSCKRDIPDNSLYCNWCGQKQIRERKQEITVPKPQQRPSGLWIASMMVEGKRMTVSAPTEKEYYAKARALKSGLIAPEAPAPKKTLDAVVQQFLADRSNTLSPTTLRSYKSYWKNHFLDYHTRQISSINWQQMVNAEAATTSPALLKKCWMMVSTALQQEGIHATVSLTPAPKHERPWLNEDEIRRFLTAIHGTNAELTALLALHSLRESEIGGLMWEDYDGRSIHVHQSLVRSSTGMVLKSTPKSRAGDRTIPVFIPRLRELLEAVPQEERTGFIITTRARSDSERIKKICIAADLPPCTNHCLRHTFATLCHRLRVPMLETQRLGGWNDIQVVQRIYTHLDEQDAIAANTSLSDFYQITTNLQPNSQKSL